MKKKLFIVLSLCSSALHAMNDLIISKTSDFEEKINEPISAQELDKFVLKGMQYFNIHEDYSDKKQRLYILEMENEKSGEQKKILVQQVQSSKYRLIFSPENLHDAIFFTKFSNEEPLPINVSTTLDTCCPIQDNIRLISCDQNGTETNHLGSMSKLHQDEYFFLIGLNSFGKSLKELMGKKISFSTLQKYTNYLKKKSPEIFEKWANEYTNAENDVLLAQKNDDMKIFTQRKKKIFGIAPAQIKKIKLSNNQEAAVTIVDGIIYVGATHDSPAKQILPFEDLAELYSYQLLCDDEKKANVIKACKEIIAGYPKWPRIFKYLILHKTENIIQEQLKSLEDAPEKTPSLLNRASEIFILLLEQARKNPSDDFLHDCTRGALQIITLSDQNYEHYKKLMNLIIDKTLFPSTLLANGLNLHLGAYQRGIFFNMFKKYKNDVLCKSEKFSSISKKPSDDFNVMSDYANFEKKLSEKQGLNFFKLFCRENTSNPKNILLLLPRDIVLQIHSFAFPKNNEELIQNIIYNMKKN